jgi:plastocyanin
VKPRTAIAVLLALGAAAPAAGARQKPEVSISDASLKPAILVVAPGTFVTWRNDGRHPHGLAGRVVTPADLAPGQTYQRRFTIPGRYDYATKDRPDVTGSLIVTGRSGGGTRIALPPSSLRVVTHRYNGTLSLSFREDYQFYDGAMGTTAGPCNGETGRGSRVVSYDIRLRGAKYTRVLRIENFTTLRSPGHVRVGHEHVDAHLPHPGAKSNQCVKADGDPISDPPADDPVSCDNVYTGAALTNRFLWSRGIAQNRFGLSNDGPRIETLECGPHYVGGLAIAAPNPDPFPYPLNLVGGDKLAWDTGNTSPATVAEVRALRAGRAVTIERRLFLHFTADCCNGWAPRDRGVLARIGAKWTVRASLRVRLTPA